MRKYVAAAFAVTVFAIPAVASAKAPEGGWGQGGAPAGHGITDPSGGAFGSAVSGIAPGGAVGCHASGGTAATCP
jgi:hypothetical protein